MQNKSILVIIAMLLLAGLKCSAQYENVWVFGFGTGIDFNGGIPKVIHTNMGIYPDTSLWAWGEGNASVCDASGRLLFYTEGYYVWDRNGNVMPNGHRLIPFQPPVYQTGYVTPTSSSAQGVIIVPMPGNEDKYYIFSLTAQEYYRQYSAGNLYYSIVDMSLNGGAGDIVPNSKGILIDSFLAEKMTAVVGDRCDNIWLLTCGFTTIFSPSQFKAYSITPSGINTTPVISNVGLSASINAPLGQFVVAPNRKKLIATQSQKGISEITGATLFDFDPATGLLSNPLQLFPSEETAAYGACFSPDNTKVYISDIKNGNIFQFDLSYNDSAAILSSRFKVGTIFASDLKLAPDGKIYFISSNYNLHYNNRWSDPIDISLGAIGFPNRAGAACGYDSSALELLSGQKAWLGLPNVVPVIKPDTLGTGQEAVSANCFANINPPSITARNDTSGWNYIWDDGTYGTTRKVDMPGTYWVSYHTPPCNYNIDTFYVSFSNGVLPDIHFRNACKGFRNGKAWATTYSGDTVTYHYLWQNDNDDTLSIADTLQNVPSGNYTLRVSTAQCDTTLSFFISEEEHHVFFLADSIVCQGTVLSFQNTSDSSFTQFYWDFGDQSSSLLQDPVHTYKETGSYEVTLAGMGNICADTTRKTITVDSLLPGTFLAEPDRICVGQEAVSFYPLVDSTAISLQWQFGDGNGLRTGHEKIQHAYDASGLMPVTMTAYFRACPVTSFTDTVYVYALPQVDLGPDTALCMNGAPIVLQNLQNIPGDYQQLWSTGDTTETLKITHPGIYSLTVRTEPVGCSSTESITISKDCYIDIPNVFTPNGDGANDYFFPRQLLTWEVTQFKMQIFNRWGKLIFETDRKDGRGWDGRFNGREQPQGVYIYLIQVTLVDKKDMQIYRGNVTLIR